jgi:protein-disulfide isomerase
VSVTRTARRSPKAEPVAKSQNRFIPWAALAARAVGAGVFAVIPLCKAQKLSVTRRWNRYPLAAGVLAAAALIGVTASAAASAQPSSTAVLAPPGATPSGGIVVGDASAPVHLVIYEDPQCPICREFEEINGATLQSAVTQGKVSVEYRMRSFLGVESVRADNALAAAQAEGKFEALRETLFAHQPVERTGGYTTDDLLALGRSVGLTDGRYVDAVRSMTYRAWVEHVDDQASRDGNVGTPQIIKVGSGALTPQQTFDAVQFRAALGI